MTVQGDPPKYFLAHLDDDTDECIAWPYVTNGRGYGQLWLDGRMRYVHALACEHHHGPRPVGLHALHVPVICHNPGCFNGRHLRWGSPRENRADQALDGTTNTGERGGQAKLTWKQAGEIRERYAAGGVTQVALADEYGVTEGTIRPLLAGRTWKV